MSTLAVLPQIRSREFWFHDGDIVLSCPHPNGSSFLYRVHKFMLTRHSVPFAEMLESSVLAARCLEIVEGVPVVSLPEPAAEIHRLLSCLYNAMNGACFRDEKRPIARCDWLLQICQKYKIVPLHQCIVAWLKTEWPATLAGWDAREAHIAALRQQHIAAGPSGRVDNMYLDDRLPEPATTLSIARTLRLPAVLRAAVYDLARRDPRADWDAFHTPGMRHLPANARLLETGVRSARWAVLSAQDLLALEAVKERQRGAVRVMQVVLTLSLVHALCVARREKLVEDASEMVVLTRDPLYAGQWACAHARKMVLCPVDEARTIKAFEAFRVSYWQAMPMMVRLES